MNRFCTECKLARLGVPRMRGDEPRNVATGVVVDMCSPHARG